MPLDLRRSEETAPSRRSPLPPLPGSTLRRSGRAVESTAWMCRARRWLVRVAPGLSASSRPTPPITRGRAPEGASTPMEDRVRHQQTPRFATLRRRTPRLPTPASLFASGSRLRLRLLVVALALLGFLLVVFAPLLIVVTPSSSLTSLLRFLDRLLRRLLRSRHRSHGRLVCALLCGRQSWGSLRRPS